MSDKFIYGEKVADVTSAENVKGILIRSGSIYYLGYTKMTVSLRTIILTMMIFPLP